MARHVLTVAEQLRGIRAALASPRTPPQLREFLEQRRKELVSRIEKQRSARRRARRKPGLLLRSSSKQAKDLDNFDSQKDALIFPLKELKSGSGGYLDWLLSATAPLPMEERTHMIDSLKTIHRDWIQTIDGYQFPVVTLSDEAEADALCTIFETLNRTGVKLSVFELLTARFWPHNGRSSPAQLRLLAIQATRSHLWPTCCSERFRIAGRKPHTRTNASVVPDGLQTQAFSTFPVLPFPSCVALTWLRSSVQ
jgi:hypothetical protein